ncbi:hypothetical protein [Halobacillus mangrovi]|uniref:nSTAND3 domain-containing NTPase n=1 Tax=Halobacillus mangrovi TaxID=402384 RepID=UPI003D99257E
MTRLQSIENSLKQINETIFQELCDSLLVRRNQNYSTFSRTGSQSGKQKTTVGTPDSFFLQQNGKYIFIEHSTNITKGVSKLKDDVEKCLDESKTGVKVDNILEIIICINFNLKAHEVEVLQEILRDTSITLRIESLDTLAMEINLHHRDLANEYLGLPLNTGQVVSIEEFIEEYNKAANSISTPLNNEFLHRESEKGQLVKAIQTNDFVIVAGPPGVGKTKLVIETIKSYLGENPNYSAYCISYKSHSLIEDLYQMINTNKDNILFVDDANRIDAFQQIIGYYRSPRKGSLKVIVTLRDYVLPEMSWLQKEYNAKQIDVMKLKDNQIVDIIESDSFRILNSEYQKEILRIADGNPRLAIMAALLARSEQRITALYDVSLLFEKYFSNFIFDKSDMINNFDIKCLGIVAFFHTLPFKDNSVLIPILNNFEIDYYKFIETIEKLERWEIIDIQYEHLKIPEQNLSTYFFYKCFVDDELLSFQTLLIKYFPSHEQRIIDCVIPSNNTFGPLKVMNKLRPKLKEHWETSNLSEEEAYKILSIFWLYLKEECFEFLYNTIFHLSMVDNPEYTVTYEQNQFSYNRNKTIQLFGELFRLPPNELKDALQLAFEFTRRRPEHLPELIYEIRETLLLDNEDELMNFERQKTLFNLLVNGLMCGDDLYTASFYEITKNLLELSFHHVKGGRKNTINIYDYSLPYIRPVREFRSNIWCTLFKNFNKHPNLSIEVLKHYINKRDPKSVKEVEEFDVTFITRIFHKYFANNAFDQCYLVQQYIYWCRRNSIENPYFSTLSRHFSNRTYKAFLKLDWDRLRDKEIYDFDNFREYEKLKEEEIRSSFKFKTSEEIYNFYRDFIYLESKSKNNWNYLKSLDFIIDETFSNNFEMGLHFLNLIISENNEANYIPRIVFENHSNTKSKAETIFSIIKEGIFNGKSNWEFSYFESVDTSYVNIDEITTALKKCNESITVNFYSLEKFLEKRPHLFDLLLEIIWDKNSNNQNPIYLREEIFTNYYSNLNLDIDIIFNAYLQQTRLNYHFDFEGEGLINILNNKPSLLTHFVDILYSDKQRNHDHKDLSFIWKINGITTEIESAFDYIIEKVTFFGILSHPLNNFFDNLKDPFKTKAEEFLLNYVGKNYDNKEKMNVILDIVRQSMDHLFERVLVKYLNHNRNKDDFSKIWWIGNGGTYSGDVIIGDIEAAKWRNLLSIIDSLQLGIELIPIKKYISGKIESCLRNAEWERKNNYLREF